MNTSLMALSVFVGWTLLLVIAIVSIRSTWFLMGRSRANEFPGGEKHGPEWYWRLNRAYLVQVVCFGGMLSILLGIQ